MKATEFVTEKWSAKYKRSIDCSNPKGFSQKAHCAGRKKNESTLNEYRNALYDFIKSKFPTWPEYVLKDFLYSQAKKIQDKEELNDFLERNQKDLGQVKWRLEKLPITLDIFTPKTQRMIKQREGGSSNPFQVPKDAERHAQQLKMIQQHGVSKEPIIVAKLNNGYDLIEGWHRTIQNLQQYPEGYTGPAWVAYGATYTSESKQGVAEAKESVKDQIEKAVIVNGGDISEYFVRSANVDKLGYSAKQKFGRSPDTGDDDFSVDYIGTNKGKPALWFYPLSYYLKNATSEAYANDMPHVWLVRIKPNAWLQPVANDNAVKQPAPNGKERVGILRKSAVPAAIFFKPAFDVVDKFYDYGSQHKRHGEVKGVAEGFSNDMSTEDMIAYLRQHHDKNLHPDYTNHLTSTNSKFVLKNIPINSIKTELSGLDRAKVEQYKQMDFSKAPPIVVGSDGNILDGYHRATVAKALGIPTIKAYVGVKGQQGVAENFADGKVKGRSRPGRVKRAGASCAGSVTDLRAKAKKYSGEKSKMYHWCANMKSGKKK